MAFDDRWPGFVRRGRGLQGRRPPLDSYDLTALRSDLARFTFLLGSDDGEQLFGHDEGETLHGLGEN